MINGIVTAEREARLTLTVRGPQGQEQPIEAVLDSGFTGFLTLPKALIVHLGLTYHNHMAAMLADGNTVAFAVYEGAVLWDGKTRDVWVLEADGGALVGMALLHRFRITMDVVDGGDLLIEKL